MRAELSKVFHFDAGHHLLRVPAGHKCARPHGHRYKVTVVVEGEVDQAVGWVMDFGRIKELMQPLLDQLDHHDLNEIEGLENSTSELIAQWFWRRLKPQLPELKAISVAESETSWCTYRGD